MTQGYELVTEWEIEDLGEMEEWVYDIEVDGAHTFIANDILVHNSLYITLDKFVSDTLKVKAEDQKRLKQKIVDCIDLFIKKEVEPFLAAKFAELANYVGTKKNTMDMKREAISDVCIIRGKKNYIMQVYDNEGVRFTEPKLKAMGVETARSSTPKIVRDELKRCLNTLLNETNDVLISEISKFKDQFMSAPLSKVASPRGVSEIDKWAGGITPAKGTPIHVKAAMYYNDLIKKFGLDKERPLIKEGDKIKFIYLKTPNPIQSSAIGFIDELPTEFGLDKYVDKETQFEKTFLSPLKSFTDIIGWQVEKTANLDDLWD